MRIKGITDEDFVNYKKPSMFIAFPYCCFKCEKESGVRCCQNSDLAKSPTYEIDIEGIVERYIANPITSAIVFGGLEPFDSFDEMLDLISLFRKHTSDDIVIYTGYSEKELENGYYTCGDYNPNTRRNAYRILKQYPNIIIKFGRFVPDQTPHLDLILGVELASENQYAKLVSKNEKQEE